jgi:hypothetical protein
LNSDALGKARLEAIASPEAAPHICRMYQ